jgi:pimeloyl-ACP methyl ester carboxylesterase
MSGLAANRELKDHPQSKLLRTASVPSGRRSTPSATLPSVSRRGRCECPAPAAACSPTVVWGTSDGIVDLEYGRRYAESIPASRFEVVVDAGHFPHIEKLDDVLEVIGAFVRTDAKPA